MYYKGDIGRFQARLNLVLPAASRGGKPRSPEMKRNAQAFAIALVAGNLWLGAPAHAAGGPCLLNAPRHDATCAQRAPAQAARETCALPAEDGARACALDSAELGTALGQMAAGGLRIAATVMRSLAEEAGRIIVPAPDL
jgi:hypothetical protein